MERPNIVLIMADQLAPHFLPNYGHRVVLAPNISRMADEGVTFDWAYTNSPLCGPSRYVMMTSCLPARIGAWDNAAEWSSEIPTFAHYLADRGYLTCLSGKMHFIGPDSFTDSKNASPPTCIPPTSSGIPDGTSPTNVRTGSTP